MEAHLRTVMADLELRVHRKLLERFDVYELDASRMGDDESILMLERNIEDVCREMKLFEPENQALLEEVIGLVLRDLVINQMILESDREERSSIAGLTYNEFDVPATLVPERETELANLLMFASERMELDRSARPFRSNQSGRSKIHSDLSALAAPLACRAETLHRFENIEKRSQRHRVRLRPAARSFACSHDF